MSVFATQGPVLSDVVKYELDPSVNYTREAIVINDTAQTFSVGAVLGKVTATGKYKLCLSAAVDGSQTPAAIYVGDSLGQANDYTVSNGVDAPAVAIVRGMVILRDAGLILGTGTTLSAVKTAFAALNPPILVSTGV
jgi:predicted ABC-type sugar transport system permease subunit